MKTHITYLRIIATISVIILHVAAFYVGRFQSFTISEWEVANFFDSLTRFCVPVFVMISGATLLHKDERIRDFFSKRFKRVIIPFPIWATFYHVMNNMNTFRDDNIYTSVSKWFIYVYQGASADHFWYIYMIIGVYLFIPIIRKWTLNASKKDMVYFLTLWAIALFINKHTQQYFPSISLLYFSYYLGYLVLGHFLDQHIIENNLKAKITYITLFILGTSLTFYLTSFFSIQKSSYVNIFYHYLTPNVALTSIGIFLFIKSIKLPPISNFTLQLESTSYGVFLIHIFVLELVKKYVNMHNSGDPYSLIIQIVAVSICTYSLSVLVIFLLQKIKPIRNIVG